jgi:hypothetical protein
LRNLRRRMAAVDELKNLEGEEQDGKWVNGS